MGIVTILACLFLPDLGLQSAHGMLHGNRRRRSAGVVWIVPNADDSHRSHHLGLVLRPMAYLRGVCDQLCVPATGAGLHRDAELVYCGGDGSDDGD